MFKHIVLVGLGSAMGGIVRYLVSRLWASLMVSAYPFSTFTVNVLGCFLIGTCFRHCLLTVGLRLEHVCCLQLVFCGGFTTFSTFMNENANFLDTGMSATAVIYTLCSLVFGFLALLLGQQVARIF